MWPKMRKGERGRTPPASKAKEIMPGGLLFFYSSRITLLPLLVAFPIFCESYFIRDEFTGEILTDVNYTAKEVGDQPT